MDPSLIWKRGEIKPTWPGLESSRSVASIRIGALVLPTMNTSNAAVSSPSFTSSSSVGTAIQAIVVRPPWAGKDRSCSPSSKSTPGVAVPLMNRARTTTSLVPV